MGRGLSNQQKGTLAHLELAQMEAAPLMAEHNAEELAMYQRIEKTARLDYLKWKADAEKTALPWSQQQLQDYLAQQQATARAFGNPLPEQPNTKLMLGDWKWKSERANKERLTAHSYEDRAAALAIGPELAWISYGALLLNLNPALPKTDSLIQWQERQGRYRQSAWAKWQMKWQLPHNCIAACEERETAQASLRRTLKRLADRGLILQNRGRLWLPEMLPQCATAADHYTSQIDEEPKPAPPEPTGPLTKAQELLRKAAERANAKAGQAWSLA